MTNIVKNQASAIDKEGEALWYALFALRAQIARRHMRNTGRPLPQEDNVQIAERHAKIVQGFFCEMGRSMPGSAR
jgi:hypothetical protein